LTMVNPGTIIPARPSQNALRAIVLVRLAPVYT
jgi:hypothetical protein